MKQTPRRRKEDPIMRKRIAAFALASVMALSLFGCGAKSNSASSAAGVSGDFTGAAKGMGGDVTVTLTLTDSKITGCTAEGADETQGIGTLALEQLPGQIAETGSIAVDGVSGATITSDAIKEAAAAALTAAGLNATTRPLSRPTPPRQRTPPLTQMLPLWAQAAQA
jgi:fumarate reductase flavoprotein subunit